MTKRFLNDGQLGPTEPIEPEAPRDQGLTGRVHFLRPAQGYGFIRTNDADYFFHRGALAAGEFEQILMGDFVIFAPGDSPKGPRAEWVKRL